MAQQELDPVRKHSASRVTRRLDAERDRRLAASLGAPPAAVSARLKQLDEEWDIERVLEANAATIMLAAIAFLAARPSRRRAALAAVVPAFLLQHAVQGWCPPIEVFRMLGRRSRNEIDAERTALKALRGDFVDSYDSEPQHAARSALDAAGRR
jgi:hypothetical protein